MDTLLPVLVLISTAVIIILLCLPTRYQPPSAPQGDRGQNKDDQSGKPSVQVLVLGDIGRSPRMQYHALSIAKHGGQVELIGYLETEPLRDLQTLPNIIITPLPSSPRCLQTNQKLLFLAFAPIKVLLQVWHLWLVLGYRTKASKWLLVQNPPSIPTLAIGAAVCFLRNTRLVIDWHNFGYSILALRLGKNHPLVQLSMWYEKKLAAAASCNFAVTDVMRSVLKESFATRAPVLTLHDRPAAIFQPLPPSARLAFLSSHPLLAEHFDAIVDRKRRVVVSSTSWTPDEDFSVLLDALCQYSTRAITSAPQLPELSVIITGKGPQQAFYLNKISELKARGELEMVAIRTAWLSFEDYASLLASADLGVSLHTSSSGVDLPMKVVDMFGAGLPVLGFDNFRAWPELVKEGVNGRGFSSAAMMGDILEQLFEPKNEHLEKLREGALRESKRRWDAEWDPVAGKLFDLI